jgi:hypothetical protein
LRSARGAQWARAAPNAQERSARSGKQGPRQCLEVWSCFAPQEMAKSSAGDFTVGKIQKTRRQRVAKMYGQQKRNIIHTSSTAYEQDHSAAAHNRRARRPGRRNFISSLRERKRRRRRQRGRKRHDLESHLSRRPIERDLCFCLGSGVASGDCLGSRERHRLRTSINHVGRLAGGRREYLAQRIERRV